MVHYRAGLETREKILDATRLLLAWIDPDYRVPAEVPAADDKPEKR